MLTSLKKSNHTEFYLQNNWISTCLNVFFMKNSYTAIKIKNVEFFEEKM